MASAKPPSFILLWHGILCPAPAYGWLSSWNVPDHKEAFRCLLEHGSSEVPLGHMAWQMLSEDLSNADQSRLCSLHGHAASWHLICARLLLLNIPLELNASVWLWCFQ